MADDSLPAVDNTTTPPAPSPGTEAAPPRETAPSQSAPSSGESAPSPSAPSKEGESRETLLQAVQKAVADRDPEQAEQGTTGGAAPAPAAQSAAPPTAPDDYSDLPDDPQPSEMDVYKAGARRRVEKLLAQRNELRAETARLKALEPQAKAAEGVTKYLKDNDIARDDFLLTLELAAAMRRGDFKTFYEGVKPYMQLAEEYLGVALPQDLQQRVAEGHMTTQAARMFARERMDRMLAESQRVRQAQVFDNTADAMQRQQLASAVTNEVNKWEQATAAADPDYAAKKAAVMDTMWAVVREQGTPRSPEHAIQIAQESYRRVNERYRSWAPPRRPTSRQPSSTGRTNGALPEAKTLKDAVAQAVERARL
jgi:hypothetical protein